MFKLNLVYTELILQKRCFSMSKFKSIVMLGSTGAVGGEVLKVLVGMKTGKLILLGRRSIDGLINDRVEQHKMNIFDVRSYEAKLNGHHIAICTLGVGEPTKISKEEFIKIDKNAVIDFAAACKAAGIEHFQLLSSVGVSSKSRSFFLRTKGELIDELKAMNFKRLSIFQPSMILTPTNRYGLSQAITLKVWPLLKPLLMSGLRKYRGIKVETLGQAIAVNSFTQGEGFEQFFWDDFNALVTN